MNKKRFKLLSGEFDENGNPLYLIKDTTDMIGDYEICKKVIEQQNIIQSLKEELKLEQDFASRWQKESEMLAKENKELKYWKKRIIEYLTDWFNKTEYLSVLNKIAEINNEIGLDSDE